MEPRNEPDRRTDLGANGEGLIGQHSNEGSTNHRTDIRQTVEPTFDNISNPV